MIWSFGDEEKTCGDAAGTKYVGMGKTYLLLGGDQDRIVSSLHSLAQKTCKQPTEETNQGKMGSKGLHRLSGVNVC